MNLESILTASATELAQLIRNKKISSFEIVNTHIEHAQKVNPNINAMVQDRFDLALKEAKEKDAHLSRVKNFKDHPFYGVPFSVKECFETVGMPHTAGLSWRKGIVGKKDATVVDRLKKAGGIVLGVTNTSEGCFWIESNNRVYGMTNNPYDPKRSAGGSSGGEGSFIGSGSSPFGVGSDFAGSIRIPAFFNGIFGHKPSGGLVPGTGQFPPEKFPSKKNKFGCYLGTGPLCRRASDLWPLIKTMSGPDNKDGACVKYNLPKKTVDFKKLKVFSLDSDSRHAVNSDLIKSQKQVLDFFKKEKSKVTELKIKDFPELKKIMDFWLAFMAEDSLETASQLLTGGEKIIKASELFTWLVKRSDHTLPGIILVLMEHLSQFGWMKKRNLKLVSEAKKLIARLNDLLDENSILLFPSYPKPAPKHFAPLLPPFQFSYTALFNFTLHPVTQVPLGLNDQNLPMGIQVASQLGNDGLTIEIANHLEKAFGGWTPPWQVIQS